MRGFLRAAVAVLLVAARVAADKGYIFTFERGVDARAQWQEGSFAAPPPVFRKAYGRRLVLQDVADAAGVAGGFPVPPLFWEEDLVATASGGEVFAQQASADPGTDGQWNLEWVREIWARGALGEGYTVAVVDSGLETSAAGTLRHLYGDSGYDFVSDPEQGLDGDGRDADWTEPAAETGCDAWHGTKIATVLAADPELNEGGFSGYAPKVGVVPVRALGRCMAGSSSDVADGVVYAAGGEIEGLGLVNERRVDVILLALAGRGACPSVLSSALELARNKSVTVVAAVGNYAGNTADYFPANCGQGVITVGAAKGDGKQKTSYTNSPANVFTYGGTTELPVPCLTAGLAEEGCVGTSYAAAAAAGFLSLYQNNSELPRNEIAFAETSLAPGTMVYAQEAVATYKSGGYEVAVATDTAAVSTIVVPEDSVCDFLVVGGGGPGGGTLAGGGGAGGVVYALAQPCSGTYTVAVGRGGVGAVDAYALAPVKASPSFIQKDGVDVGVLGTTCGGGTCDARGIGGGEGGSRGGPANGFDGGSGGGGGSNDNYARDAQENQFQGSKEGPGLGGKALQPNTYWDGTGYVAGGVDGLDENSVGGAYFGAGGGGVGGYTDGQLEGADAVRARGADGVLIGITGTPRFYAAGGAGTVYSDSSAPPAPGGSGVGGNGGTSHGQNVKATGGVDGTGSGGGGGGCDSNGCGGGGSANGEDTGGGGNGGSGVVVIRWRLPAIVIHATYSASAYLDSMDRYQQARISDRYGWVSVIDPVAGADYLQIDLEGGRAHVIAGLRFRAAGFGGLSVSTVRVEALVDGAYVDVVSPESGTTTFTVNARACEDVQVSMPDGLETSSLRVYALTWPAPDLPGGPDGFGMRVDVLSY